MDISYDLLSQLAKTITPKKETNTESTLNGTVVVDGEGNKYVRPDGSDQLIPVSSTTTNANKGERVTVLIKDHTATVTGNMSSPAARTEDVENLEDQVVEIEKFDILIAGRVETSEAYIKALQADKANIGDLQAAQAQIADLEAEKASIVELNAAKAEITDLKTTKLDATIADVTFATINSLEVTNAEVKKLEADYGEFKTLTAEKFTANEAVIEELKTGKATIVELEAVRANVTKLDSDLGDFKVLTAGQFTATDASIKALQTDKLSAKDIEGKYANIDFSNISKSTMESFYATSGLIENVVIGDATISGRLVGVVISGDLIEGGTVVAEKLVIQGTDGLYYKLNTDGMKTEAEQTDYNSLNGGILAKKSITASKIDVDDLVAFEATIGGFVIADNSIYSGVKESVDNTTRGIYLDKTGQACFGDATYFLKYYKDQNGDYKLAISADSILIGSDKKNVGTVIGDIEVDVEEVRAKAVAAQSTADTAKANAATAQTAANNAQSTADTAKANAITAQSKADEAKQAADDAQKAADDADEKAAQAQAELVTAQQNLADVTSRVNVTEEEIEAAQAAVVTAQTKADEAATNAATAQSTADTAKTNAANAQSTADTAKTNAANAQAAANEAKSIADTAKTNAANAQKAADDAQADVDALTTRVNTAETQIEQNTEAIKLSATKTEVDERLDGYYSKSQTDALLKIESDKIATNVTEIDALGTRMSTIEQTADSLTIRLANAESEIEEIEVGGRNLLRGTKDFSGFYSNRNTTKIISEGQEYSYVDFPIVETLDYRAISSTLSMINAKDVINRNVVLSFELRSDTPWVPTGSNILIGFSLCNNNSTTRLRYNTPRFTEEITTEWVRHSIAVTLNDEFFVNGTTSLDECKRFYVQIYNYSLNQLQVRKFKLEYGTIDSDWTPAPEDVNSDISDAAKTATNFMNLSGGGLVIGDMTEDELGNNVLIDADSVDIRSGDVVLASYGAERTSLGKGSKYSTIDMCDDTFRIYVGRDDEYFDNTYINSDIPLEIHSDESCTIFTEYIDDDLKLGAAKIVARSSEKEGNATSLSHSTGQLSLLAFNRERAWMDDGTLIGDSYYRSGIYLQQDVIRLSVDDYGTYQTFTEIVMGGRGERIVGITAPDGFYINDFPLSAHIIEQGTSGVWYYEQYNNDVVKMYAKAQVDWRSAHLLGRYLAYPFNVDGVISANATIDYDGNDSNALSWNAKLGTSNLYGCNIWVHNTNGGFNTATVVDVYISIIAWRSAAVG